MRKKILVLGSSNVDIILRIPRFHLPGETIIGENLITVFGGKGANQAVAASRLGGQVAFITRLGNDPYGKTYMSYLMRNGLAKKGLLRDVKLPTGAAVIEITTKGENRIIVSPGANGSLSIRDLKRCSSLWRDVSVFVTQLEIPLATVEWALRMSKDQGALTLLNPSPPVRLSRKILSLVDFLVPNEGEAQLLSGIRNDVARMAEKLLHMGAANVVITRGSKGLFFKNAEREIRMKAFRVNVVDTTAAGDAFMGAFACALCEGRSIPGALELASGAGALATTKLGAQPSLPFRQDLERFLVKRRKSEN